MVSGSGPPRTPVSSASIATIWSLESSKSKTSKFSAMRVGLRRLRNRGSPLLQVPSQHHLSGRLAVLPRDLLQRRVVECALLTTTVRSDPADRRPGLRQNAVLGVQTLQRRLLEVRMHFDLVDGRYDGRLSQQALKVVGHEVAHANRAYLAVGEQLLERAVRVQSSDRSGSAAADAGAAGRGDRHPACRRSCQTRAAWPRSRSR